MRAYADPRGWDVKDVHQHLADLARKSSASNLPFGLDPEAEGVHVAIYRKWEQIRFPLGEDPVKLACSMAHDGG